MITMHASTPARVVIGDTETTTDAPRRRAAAEPDRVVLWRRSPEGWAGVTAAEFHDEVVRLAKGLLAGGVGVGDRVLLHGTTSYAWTLVDYAIWYAGAISVPVYPTSSVQQITAVAAGSGAVAAFSDGDAATLVAAGLPEERVFGLDVAGLAELGRRGAGITGEELDRCREARCADDVATIVYTSGTTGAPQGCRLSHRNLLAVARNVIADIPEIFEQPGASTLLFLPLAHSFSRFVQVSAVESGLAVGHLGDPAAVVPELPTFRPTFLPVVPRVLEKVLGAARSRAAAEGRQESFARAVEVAVEYSMAGATGGPSGALATKHALMDAAVYGRLREALGGARFVVCGGAPLDPELAHFFCGIGVAVLEGYGLTETTAPVTANVPGRLRPGTVGTPVPGSSVSIAEDGEVLVSGPTVFEGYWADGDDHGMDAWGRLHTGDLGSLDEDGFLRITGRKKEVIVTGSGKNIVPDPLEQRVCAHPLVDRCVVVGEGRPFVACLIALDAEALATWLAAHPGPADPDDNAELRAELERALARANDTVSRAESIRRFRVLPGGLSEQSGHLTPSDKIRRSAVARDFAAEIELLYR